MSILTQLHTEGPPMYRDRLAQHRQSDPMFVETADSFARAKDHQRHARAEFLIQVFRAGDEVAFDYHFRDFYAEDTSILLVLPDDVSRRALELVSTGRQQ